MRSWTDAQAQAVAAGTSVQPEERPMLLRAQEIVHGAREQAYGSPRGSFEKLAAIWSSLVGVEITAHQAGLMMAALKINRTWDGYHGDGVLDLAGYAAAVDRIENDPEEA